MRLLLLSVFLPSHDVTGVEKTLGGQVARLVFCQRVIPMLTLLHQCEYAAQWSGLRVCEGFSSYII